MPRTRKSFATRSYRRIGYIGGGRRKHARNKRKQLGGDGDDTEENTEEKK